ncbi:hypothetical protein MNBD_ALPHA11-1837, partial [hydrothermal vent metagenome]
MTDKIFQKAAAAADFSAINQQCAPFSVRPQSPDDNNWVENLHSRAFGPG